MSSSEFAAAFQAATESLKAGKVDEAFKAVAPFADIADKERDVALGLLSIWRVTPGRPGLVVEVKRLADAYPTDPEVVTRACDALIRDGERVPPDEPPPENGAAHTAMGVAQRCLEGLSEEHRANEEILAFLQTCLGNALRLAHLYDRAAAALSSAVKKRPQHGPWWFNLGLAEKQRLKFKEGLEAAQQARKIMGDERPILWNIAICATAVGDGATAVEAFNAMGMSAYVTDSGMPQIDHMPPVQVRVATMGPGHMGPSQVPDSAVSFELLWVAPLSPCHGVVISPTYRQASTDFGDVILWDAVPVGTTEFNGRKTPRFPLLAILHRGDERKYRFVALQRSPGAIDPLQGELPLGGQLFVHRERVEKPSGEQVETGTPDERLVYGKVVVPAGVDLAEFRAAFDARVAGCDVEFVMPGLLEDLGDTAAAGKAHTMWRGIERTVEKTQKH